MSLHYYVVISIIIGSGILTGVTNFFLRFDRSSGLSVRFELAKAVLLSVCASIAVPLFLQILSNELLSDQVPYPRKNYLILAGFCVIAGIFSKRFLEDLYTRINKVEKETKQTKKQVERIEEIQTEPEEPPKPLFHGLQPTETTVEQKIIDAIRESKYALRTVKGISKNIDVSQDDVIKILEDLELKNIVRRKTKSDGRSVWGMQVS